MTGWKDRDVRNRQRKATDPNATHQVEGHLLYGREDGGERGRGEQRGGRGGGREGGRGGGRAWRWGGRGSLLLDGRGPPHHPALRCPDVRHTAHLCGETVRVSGAAEGREGLSRVWEWPVSRVAVGE